MAAPSDRIRFGIIGVGMQGNGLLSTAVGLPGAECIAAADLYDGRHTLAKEIAGAKIVTTRHYKELLDNKEIDCIIAAVPDHWHKQVFIDTVSAGKDIYLEKPMSHAASEGVEMVTPFRKPIALCKLVRSASVPSFAEKRRKCSLRAPSAI